MSSSPDENEERERRALTEGIRSVRDAARESPSDVAEPPAPTIEPKTSAPLPKLSHGHSEAAPASPDREALNALWDVAEALRTPPRGRWGRLIAPLRGPLQRIVRFALGPVIEQQVQMNSAQVRFDNEVIRYLDERHDRSSRHYDEVLGAHGKRMEEIDERHLILQQELIRHVHDLVERIEFVFESAETNHLYVEGMLRETRHELRRLSERLEALSRDNREAEPR